MSEQTATIGIDFGGTTVKAGVVVGDQVVAHAGAIATQEFDGAEALMDAMAEAIGELRAGHPRVEAVGVGMPGFVDVERGLVHNLTNVRGWTNVLLREKLGERCGLPVVVDNDANCMALAEWKRGAGRGFKNLICLTLGTGVGGGVIVGGKLVHGARFGAGEIGQMSIDYQGRVGHYGNRGALEDYIGNNEIAERAVAAYAAAGVDKSPAYCTPADLAAAAEQQDAVALGVWEETGHMLATAVMNCCWLLNPEAIILGGGVARAGEVLLGPFRSHLLTQLSGPFRDHLEIRTAMFSNDAGTIGAATLALEGLAGG